MMYKRYVIICLTSLVVLLAAVLFLPDPEGDRQAFTDNVIYFYTPDTMRGLVSEKANNYLYELLCSDNISLPIIDGCVDWTRESASPDSSYGICFFLEPFSLSLTDSEGIQKIEAITAVLLDFDDQAIYFSHQPVALDAETIFFSQGNAVADKAGQDLLAKLEQILISVKQ